jgi:hypothetical protein
MLPRKAIIMNDLLIVLNKILAKKAQYEYRIVLPFGHEYYCQAVKMVNDAENAQKQT